MYRFYVDPSQTGGEEIRITGEDVNHIKNVLRMKEKEEIIICDGQGKDFYCIIEAVSNSEIITKVLEERSSDTELNTKIYLFQGLPKKDKMELIIQKAVELGVYEVIPVVTRRTIVKFDDKKELKKVDRWQSIAVSAAKQSNRGIIPIVRKPITYKEALAFAKSLDYNVIPYEKETGIEASKKIVKEAKGHTSLGVFIGPEGGFEESEINDAMEHQIKPITLGKRILRTETAGLTILSLLMFELEEDK
ncbi:16S rRNA (uracil(1498)-N(3))-methyltransferase [Anaeromicropila herbilytica]|uniref:Ribosomal RNA small subunit methyltransferase E n=1 Tax=Anaeromicropila herbilytica TaxID=2785025 RepID=A0A7R7EMW2_9FIRM|nr:16S rRNA (uracil(1498)-N(3))-methyltransferase [Anaeromicropila herbilytica]BCN31722.1 ribosomal RNA small subunit methyltransferase E [Anaeromicropila herbilytica]